MNIPADNSDLFSTPDIKVQSFQDGRQTWSIGHFYILPVDRAELDIIDTVRTRLESESWRCLKREGRDGKTEFERTEGQGSFGFFSGISCGAS